MAIRAFIVLIVPLAIFIAGIILFFRGLRGRLIDMHPLCRKCGFDLFGLPSDSTRCSECGADLKDSRAIRIGHRARRFGMVVAGIWLMVPLLMLTGVAGYQVTQHANPWQLKPAWWLAWDAQGSNAQSRGRALLELASRIRMHQLSDAQIDRLVRQGMLIQADMARPWPPGWGEIIEQARAAGKLKESLWQQYVKQGIACRFEVRPRVRQGAAVPMELWSGPGRLSANSRIWISYAIPSLQLDGAECRSMGKRGGMSMNASGGAGTGWSVLPDDPVLRQLKPGRHSARLVLEVIAYDSYQAQDSKRPPAIKPLQMIYEAAWELVDEPTVRVVNDPALRERIEKSLSAVRQKPGASWSDWVSIDIKTTGSPVPLAFDVFVRVGPREWPAGSVAFPANQPCMCGAGARIPGLKAAAFDLLLRPSSKAAESCVKQTELWDGEVVIKAVGMEE